MTANDKNWAHDYVINPLIAPEPSDQTGPGTHFRSTFAAQSPTQSSNNVSASSIPVQTVHALHNEGYYDPTMEPVNHKNGAASMNPAPTKSGARSRGASLSEKFPGDKSHRPLSMLKDDNKAAHKTHRKRISGVDVIDSLDSVPGGKYHHEGPFDATLLTRNLIPRASPVAAVADSNREALRATPKEHIRDSLAFHRPLDGTARVPPGIPDEYGRVYEYEESNVNAEEREDLDRSNKQKKKRYEIESAIAKSRAEDSGFDEDQKKYLTVNAEEVDETKGQTSKRSSFSGLKKRLSSRRKKDQVDAE